MLSTLAARVTRVRHMTPAMAAATAVLLLAGLLAVAVHDGDGDTRLTTDRTTTTTATDLANDEPVDPATDTTLAPVVGPAGPATTPTTSAPSTTTTAPAPPVCQAGPASTIDSAGLWLVDVADGRVRRVIGEGVETFTWSPDGKHLAYLAGPQEDRRLVVLDEPGASRTVYDGSPVRAFAWTADSARLVVAVRSAEDHDSIVTVPVAGGEAIDVHDLGSLVGDLEVRPDASVVFTDGGTLAVIDADGSNRRNLIAATGGRAVHTIAVSPDGKLVAYTDGSKFGVLTITTGAVKELGSSSSPGRPLAWSSDSARVAFVPVQGGRPMGVVVRPDGSEARTVGPGADSFGLAPNGKELGWVATATSTLTATDTAIGRERVVGKDMWQPTWAPDSGSMAVYAKVAGEARPALCLVGVGTRRVAQLKGNAAPFSALAWSPSGATLAFASLA